MSAVDDHGEGWQPPPTSTLPVTPELVAFRVERLEAGQVQLVRAVTVLERSLADLNRTLGTAKWVVGFGLGVVQPIVVALAVTWVLERVA